MHTKICGVAAWAAFLDDVTDDVFDDADDDCDEIVAFGNGATCDSPTDDNLTHGVSSPSEKSESQWYTPISQAERLVTSAQCPKLITTGLRKDNLGGPAKTTGLSNVWLSDNRGLSRPSVMTARKISSV